MATLEEGYGINLVPLATFAMEMYSDDPCSEFIPKELSGDAMDEKNRRLTAQMHKAISILQFKLEGNIISRHPEWQMSDRLLLNDIDFEQGTITIDGETYPLTSNHFPTIDPSHPYELTEEEQSLISKLKHSFKVSEKLNRHIRSLL